MNDPNRGSQQATPCRAQARDVVGIVDGDTFRVAPKWTRKGQVGSIARSAGYAVPRQGTEAVIAAGKLARLVLGKRIRLGSGHIERKGCMSVLVCRVYLRGRDLADYFPEYKGQRSACKASTLHSGHENWPESKRRSRAMGEVPSAVGPRADKTKPNRGGE